MLPLRNLKPCNRVVEAPMGMIPKNIETRYTPFAWSIRDHPLFSDEEFFQPLIRGEFVEGPLGAEFDPGIQNGSGVFRDIGNQAYGTPNANGDVFYPPSEDLISGVDFGNGLDWSSNEIRTFGEHVSHFNSEVVFSGA